MRMTLSYSAKHWKMLNGSETMSCPSGLPSEGFDYPRRRLASPVTEGFEFLGFQVRQYRVGNTSRTGYKLLITPSRAAIRKKRKEFRDLWRKLKGCNVQAVLATLNPKIRGWANYYRTVVSSRVFSQMDSWMTRRAGHTARQNHPNKPKYWRCRLYFGQLCPTRNHRYVFGDKKTGRYLLKFAWIDICRHVLVRGTASPDDPKLQDYWKARTKVTAGKLTRSDVWLAERQNWTCRVCGESLFNGEELERHHKQAKSEGGSDHRWNREPLHLHCHQQVASVPNLQHHTMLRALLTSDFQYKESGLLDATHLRFYTYSTWIKLFLDAGYIPQISQQIHFPMPKDLEQAVQPLFRYWGLNPDRTKKYLEAYQYIFSATPYQPGSNNASNATHVNTNTITNVRPLSFVVCVSDEQILRDNLLSSPCLAEDSIHEILLMPYCANAAEGSNRGLESAKHEIVVCVHQDVYLPRGWDQQFAQQFLNVDHTMGPLGVVGVYGVRQDANGPVRAGQVVDRDRLLNEPLTETNDTLCSSKVAISLAKSISDRESRSTL